METTSPIKFAIVNPFPGVTTAETELVIRIEKAAKNIGCKCYILSNEGLLLDKEQEITQELINPDELMFVISTHFVTPKNLNVFYYHTVWNPPEIPLDNPHYMRYAQNYLMYDDFLIYDKRGMTNHLKGLLISKPRDIDNASMLVGSFPLSSMLKPNFSDLKLFYCGMNWDKLTTNVNRHDGLFKLLDKTGCAKFFGPNTVKGWGKVKPWADFKSYQYSIPFDGFSILNEINKCGIVLVLSSDMHRRAGSATNRLYEAIAGGAVIISDENEFIKEHFSDAALFIDYNIKKPDDTFKQIMEKYEWIKQNPDNALQLVDNAQKIFTEKFCLEKQLQDVINQHPNRLKSVESSLYAKDSSGELLVAVLLDDNEMTDVLVLKLNNALQNFSKQVYENKKLIIAADNAIFKKVTAYVLEHCPQGMVMAFEVFNKKDSRVKTDGQVLNELLKSTSHDYFINMNPSEVWFYDHVTTLIRSIEDESNSVAAYSGRLRKLDNEVNVTEFYNVITAADLFEFACFPVSGQVLFSKTVEEYVDDWLFGFVDGSEHYVYALFAALKHNKKIVFSKRMTLSYYDVLTKYKKVNQVFDIIHTATYFQDIFRYDMFEKGMLGSNRNVVGDIIITNKLAQFPIKEWMRLRIFTVLKRLMPSTFTERQKIARERFNISMNGIN